MIKSKRNVEVLGIIPARGGSKGVPGKNIKPLGGKPLIAWTIEIAKKSKRISRLIISTDSEEIASIASDWGAEVPFMRPAEFASDKSPTIDAIRYTLEKLKKDEDYSPDAVVLLQPTTPFRLTQDLDSAIDKFFEKGADCVASVSLVPKHFHPEWQLIEDDEKILLYNGKSIKNIVTRRQDLSDTLYRNGEIYVISPEVILEQNSIYGKNVYPVITETKVNIDTLEDFEYAEYLLHKLTN